MRKILFCIAALSLASPALAQQQTCRLFGGGCRPVPSAPQIIQQAGPSVDLGRLEATTDAIRGEQRYQTHILYLIYGQMQRSADLALLQAARSTTPSGVDEHGATRVPLPSEVQPTPIPLPSQVQPTPIPLPSQVQPTQIPLPIQVSPTLIPGPGFNQGQGGGGQFQQVPPPPTGGGTGIPAPTSAVRHKAWPNVARK